MNEHAWVPPLPEGDVPARAFDDAWQRGRAARRRRLLTSSGASTALGVALVLGVATVPGPTGGDSLRQVGPAAPGRDGEGSTGPQALATLPPQVGPSALPQLPPQLPVLPRTSPSPDAAADGEPSPQPDGTRQGAGDAAYAGSPSRPVQREYYSSSPRADQNGATGGSQTVCGVDVQDRPSGEQARWCGGNETAQDKGDFLLQHRQCRAHDGDQPALTFGTTQEVEYEVRSSDGALLWRWSDGVDVRPAAHELPTEPGACYEWTTRWTPLAPDGEPLQAGTYRLRTWVTSAELGARASYDSDFEITRPEGGE